MDCENTKLIHVFSEDLRMALSNTGVVLGLDAACNMHYISLDQAQNYGV